MSRWDSKLAGKYSDVQKREIGEEMPTWTDDRVELLKKRWGESLSASQIAAELGGITRSAVIGKVHRLGLSGKGGSQPGKGSGSPNRPPRQRKPRAPSQMFRPSRPMVCGNTALAQHPAYDYDPEPEPEVIENIIPLGQRCTLLELNQEKCHWPIGDPYQPDFFFCGGKTLRGKIGKGNDASPYPYCGYHGGVAYQPPAARRDHRPARG